MSIAIGISSLICCILLVSYQDWLLNWIPEPHDRVAEVLIILGVIALMIIGLAGLVGEIKPH